MKGRYIIGYRTCEHECFVLNKLTAARAVPRKVKLKDGKMYFELSSEESESAERALLRSGVAFERVRERGIVPFLEKTKKKLPLIAFVVALIVGAVLYSFTVNSVRVPGLKKVDGAEVLKVVEAELPSPFIFPGTDFTALERKLLNIDGVAYASVVKDGRSIVVNIVEELPEIPLLDTQNLVPLPAKEGGVITKIVVLSGTKRVEVGDTVQQGEILIDPYVASADGEYKGVPAMGIIEAKVRRVEEVPYPEGGNAAELILARKQEFESRLEEGAKLIDYSFEIKKVDKTTYLSIYYDIITRI